MEEETQEIVKGADGKPYVAVKKLSGEFVYEEFTVPSGMELVDNGDSYRLVSGGSDVGLRDIEEYKRQRDSKSSDEFFDRRRIKKMKAVSERLQRALTPVSPGVGANIRNIKDEEYFELHRMYNEALVNGNHKQCPFQPLATYRHNITRARPVLKGEVGVYGNQIICLEEGYGGTVFNVPEKLEEE